MSKSARHPDVLYPFLRCRYLVVRLRRLDSTGRLGALYSTTSRVVIMGLGTCRRASSTAVKTMCASGAEPVQDRERCARPRHLSSRTPRAALTAVTPSCRSYDFFTTYRSLERASTCAERSRTSSPAPHLGLRPSPSHNSSGPPAEPLPPRSLSHRLEQQIGLLQRSALRASAEIGPPPAACSLFPPLSPTSTSPRPQDPPSTASSSRRRRPRRRSSSTCRCDVRCASPPPSLLLPGLVELCPRRTFALTHTSADFHNDFTSNLLDADLLFDPPRPARPSSSASTAPPRPLRRQTSPSPLAQRQHTLCASPLSPPHPTTCTDEPPPRPRPSAPRASRASRTRPARSQLADNASSSSRRDRRGGGSGEGAHGGRSGAAEVQRRQTSRSSSHSEFPRLDGFERAASTVSHAPHRRPRRRRARPRGPGRRTREA